MGKLLESLNATLLIGLVLAILIAVFPDSGYRAPTGDLVNGVLQWLHVFFGITWIGLLYFFNVVQVPAYAEMEAAARSEALRKVTSRALWWFRWAAVMTMASGLLMWAIAGSDYKPSTSLGLSITFGSILGLTMGANVWMVIWPNQKINIASAEAVAAGGQPDPAAANAASNTSVKRRVAISVDTMES